LVTNRELKVGVLFGGIGAERDVSLQSGRGVAEALEEAGFCVVAADVRPDALDVLEDTSIDVFFPALHGVFGEDGRLQQILEDKSLLYTGSGPTASRLAFDKMASKKLFDDAGITVPAAVEFRCDSDVRRLEDQLRHSMGKIVVKPIRQGSSVGVRIVSTPREVLAAAKDTLAQFGDCMIEEFIPGREVTVGILRSRALPVIEIRTQNPFYNYQAKYVDDQTQFLFDTIADPAVLDTISRAAVNCFRTLGCRHFARVDFILSHDGVPYALEVNTIPGFTSHSLLPKAAAKTGISMSDLCAEIVEAACSSLARRRVQEQDTT
jgi:D-alanine-D-alanine ligase